MCECRSTRFQKDKLSLKPLPQRKHLDEKLSGTNEVRKEYAVAQFTYEFYDYQESFFDGHFDIAFQINFKRSLLDSDISAWKNKSMTGFHAEWHLESKYKTHMNASQAPLFTWGRTKLFQKFMRMVNSSISSGRITVESAMERFKHLKKDWILRNREKLECTYNDISMSTLDSRKIRKKVSVTQTGLALKVEELEKILSEYSKEIKYKDNATEIREGDLEITISYLQCSTFIMREQ